MTGRKTSACSDKCRAEQSRRKRAARHAERDLRPAFARGERSGLSTRIRHDFRRTAVRNLVNRGVPERVAMEITGHKTGAVFDRYHIVSPADLQEAARKQVGIFAGISAHERQAAAV